MVGLTGVIGPQAAECPLEMLPATVADERRGTHRERAIAVRSAFHGNGTAEQPAETTSGALVWVWGEVYAIMEPTGRRRVDPYETAAVCATAYAEDGRAFVTRLDGEFAGCIYDPTAGEVLLFGDRLGTRPLYTTPIDGGLAFSTSIQTLPDAAGYDPVFEYTYLAEYLYSRRAFGTRTPLKGVDRMAPATVVTYDLRSKEVDTWRYWTPEYRPVNKPLSYFTRELATRLEAAVADRIGDDREHGLLLSGGSDARAVLAAADTPLRSYHMNDGWNREARVAKRSANAAGAPFEELYRGPDYHETLLERAPPIMDFLGPFDTAHTLGFGEELTEGVDVLLTGLFGDTLFGAWSLPQPEVPLPFGASVGLPTVSMPTDAAEYVKTQTAAGPTRTPRYLNGPSFGEILSANVHDRPDGTVDHHGIIYESVPTLVKSELYHPVTNGVGFDLLGSLQLMPTRNPFLDRRLIDLHLRMPLEYRLRHEPVHRAIDALDPALGALPHATTRVPVNRPWATHEVGVLATDLRDKIGGTGRSAPAYHIEDPWQDVDELIRVTDFVERALERNESVGRELPLIDWDGVEETYRRHLAGEDNGQELYRLLTVLEMPLTRRIVGAQ